MPLKLHVPIYLRWGDLDAYNHVNNVSLLKILEEARVRALWRHDGFEQLPPTAVIDAGATASVHTLIAHQEIDYLRPLSYRIEAVDVRLHFTRIGGASATIAYEIFDDESASDPYIRARTTLVKVNATTSRPQRLDLHEREAWLPYLDADS